MSAPRHHATPTTYRYFPPGARQPRSICEHCGWTVRRTRHGSWVHPVRTDREGRESLRTVCLPAAVIRNQGRR